MTRAYNCNVGDRVILDGEYYDDGIATQHVIVRTVAGADATGASGRMFEIVPPVDTCSVPGLEGLLDSGWFTKAG